MRRPLPDDIFLRLSSCLMHLLRMDADFAETGIV